MLQTLDEVKKTRGEARVINGVDDPNLMSVDSTTVIETDADKVEEVEEKKEVAKEVVKEKKEEVTEVKKEEKEKKEEVAEEKVTEKKEVKSKDKVQERIDELTKKRRTAEREKEFIAKKLAAAEEELVKLKTKIPSKDKPKRSDFEDDDLYLEALTDWKVEEKLKVQQEASTKTNKEKEDKAAVDETFEVLDTVMEKGRAKYNDYNKLVLTDDLALTEVMTEAVLESESEDIAAEIFYYLGQNPDEAADIAKMSPLKAAREIERIAAKVLSKVEEKEEDKAAEKEPAEKVDKKKKLTQADEPIKPVKTSGGIDKDPNQMNPREYRAWRTANKG